jgi:hypothetical protein
MVENNLEGAEVVEVTVPVVQASGMVLERDFTPEQVTAVLNLEEFLLNTDPERDRIATLVGVAGAGKTYCLRYLINKYREKFKICGGTVSHSAKDVLQASLSDIPCYTIAQLLGLKRVIKYDGTVKFEPDSFSNKFIAEFDVAIIDECSMISDEYLNYIYNNLKVNAKVIFVGDPFQLPPVEEETTSLPICIRRSKTFDYKIAELFSAVRYSGPLLDLNTAIRKQLVDINSINRVSKNNLYVINKWQQVDMGLPVRTSKVEGGTGYVFINNQEDVMRLCQHYFADEDENFMRVVAYRNNTLSDFNSAVRKVLFKDYLQDHFKLETYMPGELVVSNCFYKTLIKNNDNFIIEAVENGVHPAMKDVPCLLLKLKHIAEMIPVVDPNNNHAYSRRLNDLKDIAKSNRKGWIDYYFFRDSFAYFDYSYTQTSHRSQGRTYGNVIVIEEDILSVEKAKIADRIQSLYVATSRAKNIAFIYNPKFPVDNSNLPEDLKTLLAI